MKRKRNPIIPLRAAVTALGVKTEGIGKGEDIRMDVDTVNIYCPVCSSEHRSKRRTFTLNFKDDVFGCLRCNFTGGVNDFISYYTGWPASEVSANVRAGKLANCNPGEINPDLSSSTVSDSGNALAPLAVRDEIYRAMLSALTLSDAHRQDLRRRGLSDEDINRIGFRSFPKTGIYKTVIPKRLLAQGYQLSGVPGFAVTDTGAPTLTHLKDTCYLIPTKDADGFIQGFQVRFDHPSDTVPKYGYFSSAGMPGGTRCGTWCSWAGESIAARKTHEPFDVVLIEGPLKAYIVNCITGLNVISVPGVAALTKVESAVAGLKNFGLRAVYVAYDMDSETNPQVAKHLNILRQKLDAQGIAHATLKWDSRYKGLDDFVTQSEEFRALLDEYGL